MPCTERTKPRHPTHKKARLNGLGSWSLILAESICASLGFELLLLLVDSSLPVR